MVVGADGRVPVSVRSTNWLSPLAGCVQGHAHVNSWWLLGSCAIAPAGGRTSSRYHHGRWGSAMIELPTYQTILFATDGSIYAEQAERHALALALGTGARMEGVYVVDSHAASQFAILAQEALGELTAYGETTSTGSPASASGRHNREDAGACRTGWANDCGRSSATRGRPARGGLAWAGCAGGHDPGQRLALRRPPQPHPGLHRSTAAQVAASNGASSAHHTTEPDRHTEEVGRPASQGRGSSRGRIRGRALGSVPAASARRPSTSSGSSCPSRHVATPPGPVAVGQRQASRRARAPLQPDLVVLDRARWRRRTRGRRRGRGWLGDRARWRSAVRSSRASGRLEPVGSGGSSPVGAR